MFKNYIKKIAIYVLLMGFILNNTVLVFSGQIINNVEIEKHFVNESVINIPQDEEKEEDVTKTITQLNHIFQESCQFINLTSDLSCDFQENETQIIMLNEFNTHKTIKPLYISILLVSCLYLSSLKEDVENKFSPENKLFFLKNLKKHTFINAVEEKNLFNSKLLLDDLQKLHKEMSKKIYELFIENQLNKQFKRYLEKMSKEEYKSLIIKKLDLILIEDPKEIFNDFRQMFYVKNIQGIKDINEVEGIDEIKAYSKHSNLVLLSGVWKTPLNWIENDNSSQFMEKKKNTIINIFNNPKGHQENPADLNDKHLSLQYIKSLDITMSIPIEIRQQQLKNSKKSVLLNLLSYSKKNHLQILIQLYKIKKIEIEKNNQLTPEEKKKEKKYLNSFYSSNSPHNNAKFLIKLFNRVTVKKNNYKSFLILSGMPELVNTLLKFGKQVDNS